MRNRKSVWAVIIVSCAAWCNGGCIDGAVQGLQGGVEDAVSAAVETIINNALAPILDNGGEAE